MTAKEKASAVKTSGVLANYLREHSPRERDNVDLREISRKKLGMPYGGYVAGSAIVLSASVGNTHSNVNEETLKEVPYVSLD